ncbi:hypothetical protein [Streptomyces zaomyceticus]|uniref:hypothetical protein n=1 Tax=Streptomyces zaomyceticus TaxID=68286 RepID=UPI002E0F5010|nr:hypothetical protein OG237_36930 [Streptomyces zaomyceticus]
MTALLTLFGVLGGIGVVLVSVLLRRSGRRTTTTDGLLIEREARAQAQIDRVSYNARAVHNSLPTASDAYHRRKHR